MEFTIKDLIEERDKLYKERAEWLTQFYAERDRRYAEVAIEREKAIKIKEQADRDALELAREIQKYKDEKANDLREQINRERILYASKTELIAAIEKLEATVKPMMEYVASQQGRSGGLAAGWGYLVAVIAMAVGISSLIGFFFFHK